MNGKDTEEKDDIEEEAEFWRNHKGKTRHCGLVAVETIAVLLIVILAAIML